MCVKFAFDLEECQFGDSIDCTLFERGQVQVGSVKV